MRSRPCSRRDFIKLTSLGLLGLGFTWREPLPRPDPIAIGRVTTSVINIRQSASYLSEPVGQLTRDQLVNLLEETRSLDGPSYNPRWYRIDKGYIHSAYIQRIDYRPQNTPLEFIPAQGILAEVTVPFVRTFWRSRAYTWEPLYRLYYESVHWIDEVVELPDGKAWYRLADPKNDSTYYAPAEALRPIDPEEYQPTARDVPAGDKRIVISIGEQTMTAYEGEKVVLQTRISSGLPTKDPVEGDIPTDTPKGFFRISQKMPSRHMGNGRLTNEIEAYELPGVPWTMAFYKTGVALHGSYWHDNFGHKMSHGCINMRNADALWLFRWTDPVYDPVTWYKNGLGTLVQVF